MSTLPLCSCLWSFLLSLTLLSVSWLGTPPLLLLLRTSSLLSGWPKRFVHFVHFFSRNPLLLIFCFPYLCSSHFLLLPDCSSPASSRGSLVYGVGVFYHVGPHGNKSAASSALAAPPSVCWVLFLFFLEQFLAILLTFPFDPVIL